MSCEKYIEQIPLYLLNELDESSKKELDEHLKTCEACRIELEEMEITISALESSNDRELPELERLRIQNEIYKSLLKTGINKQVGFSRITHFIMRTAAAIVIFAAGYLVSSFVINNSQYDHNQNSAKIEEYLQSADHKVDLSGYKFTPEGLKVIAKGKAAILESK